MLGREKNVRKLQFLSILHHKFSTYSLHIIEPMFAFVLIPFILCMSVCREYIDGHHIDYYQKLNRFQKHQQHQHQIEIVTLASVILTLYVTSADLQF